MTGSPLKIVTITKEDEATFNSKPGKTQKSLAESLKPQKSALKSKRSEKGSPNKSPTKFVLKEYNHDDSLTREQILEKLAMTEKEAEKEIDLNETSITGSAAKSKKDLSKSLIANLDNEVDNLKSKRSAVMAERDRIRKEQIKKALEDENEEEDPYRLTFSKGLDDEEKPLSVTSALQRKAYQEMEDLLSAHKERMGIIEREYEERTNELVSQITDERELARLADDRAMNIPDDKRGKDKLKQYSKVDPPPSLNSYMVNPFLMRKKKETPKEKKLATLKSIKKKRDDLKTYKERFLEYVEDKKQKVERQQREPTPQRKDKMEFRVKVPSPERKLPAQERTSYISAKNDVVMSPSRKSKSSPSGSNMVSPQGSVKKLASKLSLDRKTSQPRASVQDVSQNDLRNLLDVFLHLKKGEKPAVNKDDIWNCIMKNPHQFDRYNLDLMSLRANIHDYPSEFKSAMTFEEFVAFLKDPHAENEQMVLEVIHEIETLEGDSSDLLRETFESRKRKDFVRSVIDEKTISEMQKLKNKFENFCLLSEDQLDLFKQIYYKKVNSFDSTIMVKRLDFVEALRADHSIQAIFSENAVYVSDIRENISVNKVLRDIVNDYKRAPARQKKLKENINLDQFIKFFTNYEFGNLDDDDDQGADLDDGDNVDIQEDRLQFFKDIFESLPKDREGLTQVSTFLEYLRETDFYKAVSDEVARQKALLYEVPTETISETLNRMESEVSSITWDEFKHYFTRKGRPIKVILSLTDVEKSSRQGSRILESGRNEAYKTRLVQTLEEEEEDEDDIMPTVAEQSKHMRYNREDKDTVLNKKAFKAALEAAEEEIEAEENYHRLKAEEEELKKAEELRKKVYGSKFGALYKESDDYKITEPVPFKFDARDKDRNKTIRERKLEEMLLEKEQKELGVINVHFRANSVPAHVKTPLFERFMQAQEDRRREVREQSKAVTLARENPFSFYYRDQDKPKDYEAPLNPEFGVRFKANPVPENVKERNLWKTMQEKQDAERMERIARLAEENYYKASLPPRMASYEKERKQREASGENYKKSKYAPVDKKPFRANPIPDFKKLQKNFQNLLDEKRKGHIPTEPQPFAFQETRKGVTRHYLDKDNQMKKAAKDPFRKDPFEAVEKLKATKPKHQPPTTKKVLAMMDKLKQEREARENRILMKKEEEEKRQEKYRKMKPRVQCSSAIVDNAREKEERDYMIKEEIRRTMMENQRKFEHEMRVIKERVEARPLLVEQEGEKNQRISQARRDMEGYGEEEEGEEIDLDQIDLNALTPEQREYLIQAGYLRVADEYEEGVAEEEEGEEEDQDEEGHHQGQQQRYPNEQMYQGEHDYEEEEGEEGEEGEEDEEDQQYEEEGEGEEYEEEEYQD